MQARELLTPEEIRNEAIRRSREDEYYGRGAYRETAPEPIDLSRKYEVSMTEDEWADIADVLDRSIKQCQVIIARTYKFPSDTISSSVTRDRYNARIRVLENYKERIFEKAS